MNGYELINKVKAIRPKIRIIILSAYNITQDEITENLNSDSKIDGLICKEAHYFAALKRNQQRCPVMNN